jgi:hypothetical protein
MPFVFVGNRDIRAGFANSYCAYVDKPAAREDRSRQRRQVVLLSNRRQQFGN